MLMPYEKILSKEAPLVLQEIPDKIKPTENEIRNSPPQRDELDELMLQGGKMKLRAARPRTAKYSSGGNFTGCLQSNVSTSIGIATSNYDHRSLYTKQKRMTTIVDLGDLIRNESSDQPSADQAGQLSLIALIQQPAAASNNQLLAMPNHEK